MGLRRIVLLVGMALLLSAGPGLAENTRQKPQDHGSTAIKTISLNPIGEVKKQGERAWLEIYPQFAPALQGLQDFSHVWVLYWFHDNDRPEARQTLQVHPRRNPANPLTGVFACRAPVRPNLIGFTACRIIQITGSVVEVADLDALTGSPILDLKPYIPDGDSIPEARTAPFVNAPKKSHH